MSTKTRNLTLSALFAALTVAALYISAFWPAMQLSIAAFASIFTAAAVVEAGLGAGVSVFIVSSALGALLLPDKWPILPYVLFFGYYPVIKSIFERLRNRVIEWILKLSVFNAALTVIWFLFRELVFGTALAGINTILIYLGGSAVFAVFDYGFSKLIWLYECRIGKYRKRK